MIIFVTKIELWLKKIVFWCNKYNKNPQNQTITMALLKQWVLNNLQYSRRKLWSMTKFDALDLDKSQGEKGEPGGLDLDKIGRW